MTVDPLHVLLVAALAFLTSIVGGVSGFGAGLLIAPFLVPLVGVKAAVPCVVIAMIFGNLSRAWVYREHMDLVAVARLLPAIVPGLLIGSSVYQWLTPQELSLIVGTVVIASLPLRRLLARRTIRPRPLAVASACFLFGTLAGSAPGGGVVVISVLLGLGFSGPALIATDAAVGLLVTLINTTAYISYGVLDAERIAIGAAVGCGMIPGAFAARYLATKLGNKVQVRGIELFVLASGLYFIHLGLFGSTD